MVKVQIIFCGQSGQCGLALRQDSANTESIRRTRMMHTEGGLRSGCTERALTAHTLSDFFIGTQEIAQSSALNTSNRKGGNGIFIRLSSSGWSDTANKAMKQSLARCVLWYSNHRQLSQGTSHHTKIKLYSVTKL